LDNRIDRDYDWRIDQEVEFGSQNMRGCARKKIGAVNTPWIAMNCFQVSEGHLQIYGQIFLCLQVVNLGMVDTYMDT